ncbi:MAG: hypothetical protein ACXADF_15000 [Candidatus Thorarchaeota archaeon]|jgi:hypothetical protein
MDWTIKPPEEPGYYWFYGWKTQAQRGPNLYCITTVLAPKGVKHYHGFSVLYFSNLYGMWARIQDPTLPPIPPKDMELDDLYTYRTEDEKGAWLHEAKSQLEDRHGPLTIISTDAIKEIAQIARESERELCTHRASLAMRSLGIHADDRNKVLAAIEKMG